MPVKKVFLKVIPGKVIETVQQKAKVKTKRGIHTVLPESDEPETDKDQPDKDGALKPDSPDLNEPESS